MHVKVHEHDESGMVGENANEQPNAERTGQIDARV